MSSADELPEALQGLEPRALWEQFDAIRRIPRMSRREEGVRTYLRGLAKERGWEIREDDAGNMVLAVPGRGRGADVPPLAIQGHMDMVCVSDPDVEHDFTADPIQLQRVDLEIEGRTRTVLQARGTTLGSDNGIGICTGLALALSDDLDTPPLELIFTADEEEGMSGALGLDGELVHARRMLNLDAEEEGSIYISSAGGRELHAEWTLPRESPGGDEIVVEIAVQGLRGGHSGVDIHDHRANAVKLLVGMLVDKRVELDGVRLASCDGGGRANAIPPRAVATLWCPPKRAELLEAQLRTCAEDLRATLGPNDEGFELTVRTLEGGGHPEPVDARSSWAILKVLNGLPDGVLTMSKAIDGLVETSTNLGIVATDGDRLRIVTLTRSSKDGEVERVQSRMESALEASAARVSFTGAYPGWEADLENPLLKQARVTFERMFEKPPAIKAIHAGLECGVLLQRLPGMKAISYGPEIRDAHTTRETLVLETVDTFFAFTRQLVLDLVDA